MIAHLQAIAEKAQLPKDSILRSKVLYSGTHCGDIIPHNELPLLRDELRALSSASASDLRVFLDAFESLLQCAEREENPIVFA